MTALAQGMAGIALVMSFALLCIRQVSAAYILLAAQSAAAAITAVVLHQPLMAIPPILLAGAIWLIPDHLSRLEPRTVPFGGAKLGVAAAAVVAVLCQSLTGQSLTGQSLTGQSQASLFQPGQFQLGQFQLGQFQLGQFQLGQFPLDQFPLGQPQAALALPMSVILLSVLLAATRRHPLMHVMALVSLQNGIVLTAAASNTLLPLTCLALPLPLAAGILLPHLRLYHPAHWHRWIDLGLASAILLATVLVPLDPTATVFAPLLALDGVFRSWQRTTRPALPPIRRTLDLLTGLFPVLAVCPPNPVIGWLAILACITTSLLPTLTRRWDDAVLAMLGAGIALFGLTAAGSSLLAYLSIFAGFTAIAAVVPDLAPVLVIVILRLATQIAWPPSIEALGIAIATIALLACAALLRGRPSLSLLQQGQAAIAAIAIALGQSDGRFAALVLLILLILSRAAARITAGPATAVAIAAIAGVPPLGVFPGLVLVVLAVTGHHAWLLLPIAAGCIPILLAGVPHRLPALTPSVGWLPLALALLTGYFAPDGLVRWWHTLTAGQG